MSIKAFIAGLTLKMKVIFAVAAILVVGGTAAVVGYNVTKEDTYRVLKVFEMTGVSTVSREGSGDLEAYVGMNLESGDVLSVGEDSTLRIVLDNDKYILLDSGTVLALNADGTAADSRTSIELKQGSILNEITNPLSANSSYEVNAPKATMAVRGTSFSVSVTDDGNGGYDINETTYHGVVRVSILDKDGNVICSEDVDVDKAVDIHTSKNEETGNPAEKDGTAEFVLRDENGSFRALFAGESPVHDAVYEYISMMIRTRVVESSNTNLMDIDQIVVTRIMGAGSSDSANASSGGKTDEGSSNGSAPETRPADTESTSASADEIGRVKGGETEAPELPEETASPVSENDGSTETSAPVTEPEAITETPSPDARPEVIPETAPAETSAPITETNTDTETSPIVPETEKLPETTVPEDLSGSIITDEVEKPITRPKSDTNDGGSAGSLPRTPDITTVPVPSVPDYGYTGTPGRVTVTSPAEETKEDEKVYYNVSFTVEGEVLRSEQVEEGRTVTDIPEIPVKDGHTAVWVYGDDAAEFTADTVITADTSVYALYTEIPAEYATVTYYASYDSTTPIATETVAIGSRPTGASVPKYSSGKDWLIWGFNAASLPMIEGDTEITVPYVDYSNVVEVMIVDGNRSVLINKLVMKGDTVTLPTVPTTLDGKDFIGWGSAYSGFENGSGLKPGSDGKDKVDSLYGPPTDGTLAPGDEVPIYGNIKYYAVYKEKATATFMIGSDAVYTAEGYNGEFVLYSEAANYIASMDDYRWYYTDETGEREFTYSAQLNGNITISAKPYTVTFTSGASEPVIVTSYSRLFTLKSDYGSTFEYNGTAYSAGDTITLTEDNTNITITA